MLEIENQFDMTLPKNFSTGFLIGLSVFILTNGLAAHLLSDCGLPAILGLSACADDISRAGFPFIFYEQGGLAYRSEFNLALLVLDLLIGLGFAAGVGFFFKERPG